MTAEQNGDGGLAHLTMQSAMAVPTAVAADGLQGIWGAGQAASVSNLPAAGARLPLGSVQAGQGDLRLTPVQGAIRTAAASLSAAISLAQDHGTGESFDDAPLPGAVPKGHVRGSARGIRGANGGGSQPVIFHSPSNCAGTHQKYRVAVEPSSTLVPQATVTLQ